MKELIIICMVTAIVGVSYGAGTWTTLPVGFVPKGISGDNILGLNQLYNLTTQSYTTLSVGFEPIGISGDNIIGGNQLYNLTTQSYTTLNYFPALTLYAYGISGNRIVGVFQDHNYKGHGFIYNNGGWTTLDHAGVATETSPYAISGNNIVGDYYDDFGEHGFLYDGTSWTTLRYPQTQQTYPCGISGNSVVGYYYEIVGFSRPRGFLYNITTQSYTTLNYPGADYTVATGISGNNIVGWYEPGSHGFLYTLPEPPSLLLHDPNGGEVLCGFQTYTISWSNTDFISAVRIEYSTNNGQNWNAVSPPNTGNTGSYNWSVPLVASNACLIRISDYNDPNVNDISNNVFEIYEPKLSVIQPNGGERLLRGSDY